MQLPLSLPKLVAHRGWRSRCPENTIAAYREAAKVGARYVECDLQLTRDLEPVLYHDVSLARVSGAPGTVFDHRWETLKKIGAAETARLGQAWAGEPVAHLRDFVDFLRGNPQLRAFVEMKEESLERYGLGSVMPRVLEILDPVKHQCDMISFSLEWCRTLRRDTHYPVGFIAQSFEQLNSPEIRALSPDFECVDWRQLPREGSLARPGAALLCWEINDPGLAMKLHARGLHFVETYEIGEMNEALSRLASDLS
jgi:glycerophosphoryl diester phosphodiesterase